MFMDWHEAVDAGIYYCIIVTFAKIMLSFFFNYSFILQINNQSDNLVLLVLLVLNPVSCNPGVLPGNSPGCTVTSIMVSHPQLLADHQTTCLVRVDPIHLV